MTKIKKYAPVTIPTLCRYEKFRACLESLEACTGAEYTDVFISLDYPAKGSHWDGYRKIDAYLKEKEEKNRFKSLIVVRRDHNYGPFKNWLTRDIYCKYDRIITSEDDNVFSPNFLQFMNLGLQMAENDTNIYAVNGYTHPYGFKFANNNYFFHNTDFSAWGCGILRDRAVEADKLLDEGFLGKTFSLSNYFKVRKRGWRRLYNYLNYVFHDFVHDNSYLHLDTVITTYLLITGKYVMKPKLSLARNIGWDESGCSFEKMGGVPGDKLIIAKEHMSQKIDTATDFQFLGDPLTFFDENNIIAAQAYEGYMSYASFLKSLVIMVRNGLRKIVFKKSNV